MLMISTCSVLTLSKMISVYVDVDAFLGLMLINHVKESPHKCAGELAIINERHTLLCVSTGGAHLGLQVLEERHSLQKSFARKKKHTTHARV